MKTKNFTRFLGLSLLAFGIGPISSFAQIATTGPGWDNLQPTSQLVISENFQGFDFFHNDTHPNAGNSDHLIDGGEIIPGYKDLTTEVTYAGSEAKATYSFIECAFAPEWGVAGSVMNDGTPIVPDPTTPKVSTGFVEISREDNIYSNPPTIEGFFVIDLRNLEFVEGVQYSHSSCGGNKRGFMLEFSLDNGDNWDTLRYQPAASVYAHSFTKDPFTLEKTANTYNCQPSAYGMLWEDAIYASNVMLRFRATKTENNQTVRIHDLKVYGDLPTGVEEWMEPEINVSSANGVVRLSEIADVVIYNISGSVVKTAEQVQAVAIDELPDGVYIVKAIAGSKSATVKVINQ